MASGSNNLTSYKAKQIIGSSIAASPSGALLLTGEHYTGNTWLYHYGYGGTTNPWGIFHDTTAAKLIIRGSGTDSFWIKMDTGDTYILGKVGIGYDPNTTGNNYKLYVNGTSNFTGTMRLENGSGDWSTPSQFQIVCANNRLFSFKPTLNGQNVDIGWDWANVDGSGAAFRGTDQGGGFIFFARTTINDVVTTAQLTGTAEGQLTWEGTITANGGYLKSTLNSNTVTIGSQNTSFCHITNSADIPFWFNKTVQVDGNVVLYQQNTSLEPHYLHLGGTTNATMTAASTNPRICFTEGASTQPVYLIYTDYDNYRGPAGLKVIGGTDATPAWFEIEGDLHVGRNLRLYRNTGVGYGRLHFYSTYKTWSIYMSDAAASACPSGGTPSTLGDVTNWALRSYIENSSGYGWIWESAAESNTGTPTARMALNANNGNLTLSGNLVFTNSGTAFRGINYGTMGDNDQWRIGGAATAANAGYMELATADDGNEPIYVRQYTGVFSTVKRTLTLLDANGNTTVPGSFGIANTSSSSGLGISLYNGAINEQPTYGIMFAGTATFGKCGDVSNDWATYFTMNRNDTRGWIFKSDTGTSGNYASVSGRGHFFGSTQGCSWIDGQRYTYAAYNVGDATNTGSYWPWMRGTNTGSARWFSFGNLNNQMYIMSSATSRTENAYDRSWVWYGNDGHMVLEGGTYHQMIQMNTTNSECSIAYNGKSGETNWVVGVHGGNFGWWNGSYWVMNIQPVGRLWVGRDANDGERQIGVQHSTSGTLYMWAHASGKGLYSGAGYKTGDIIRVTSSAVTFYGALSGNASTATKLETARAINGTNFDGSAAITTSKWGTARNIYIADNSSTNTGPAVSVNGGGNATLKLPATIKATLTGNADTASKVGASTSWLYFNNSNEVNFGGTNTSTTIYFGYRNTDSRSAPTTYIFGNGSSIGTVVRAWRIWANSGPNTGNNERNMGVDNTNAGSLYMYASTSGKGIYSGSGYCTGGIIAIDSSYVYMSSNYYNNRSSRLIKENIRPIFDWEIKKIFNLNPVFFNYKKGFGPQSTLPGLIAEEVEPFFPDVVTAPKGARSDKLVFDEHGGPLVKNIDYTKFIPYLIKLAQIQQKEIDTLREQVNELSKT